MIIPLFDVLVIDETSRLKDPSGKRARALLQVAGRFRTRWGLTGTPRPNSAMDLFMPAAIITDGALWGRAFVPWQKRHFRPRDPFKREWVALPGAETQIAAEFGTVAMTVADADMPDLPPLNVVVTSLQLPDAVMATYRTMQRELFAAIDGRAIEAVSPLVATGKCAQLANGFLYGENNADPVFVHSLKIDWLRELVESLDGEPLLIAYEFIEDLRSIRRAFGAVPALGGPTPADEAKRLVEAWNAGALPLLALHPASAGHGLNLQHGGSRMAWLSPSWSAELTEQAIARIYRPGQTQHVTIHVCVAAGTVDEMKRDRVLGKMSAQEAFKRHLERVLMQARTAFRLAMLANGYLAAPERLQAVDRAGLADQDRRRGRSAGVGPQRADLDRPEDRRRSCGDRCRRRARRISSTRWRAPSTRTFPSCSRTAWCATPAASRKPGSRASMSPLCGSPRGAGIAAAIRTIPQCQSIWSSASARAGPGSSRSTGRMPATVAAR